MDAYPGPIGALVGLVVFVGAWSYAVATYGVFLGGGLGWLPAFVLAIVAAWLWPLAVVAIASVALLAR